SARSPSSAGSAAKCVCTFSRRGRRTIHSPSTSSTRLSKPDSTSVSAPSASSGKQRASSGRGSAARPPSGVSCKSVFSCFEDLAGVGPLERRGCLVVGLDEREHLLGQILLACEDAVLEQPPPED